MAELGKADLTGANLDGSDMTEAHFFPDADLTGAELTGADLTGADLNYADMSGAHLNFAKLIGAKLDHTNLSGASLFGADLTGASLDVVDFGGTLITDLTGADLYSADLSETSLSGTDLSDANFTAAKLWNTFFEPMVLPPINTVSQAEGLRTLRWKVPVLQLEDQPLAELPNPAYLWSHFLRKGWAPIRSNLSSAWKALLQPTQRGSGGTDRKRNSRVVTDEKSENIGYPEDRYPILDLVRALHAAGYREAEAEVNLAYHRRIQSWWQIPLFDWTCEWGANWMRPIWIVLVLGAFCCLDYWAILRFVRERSRVPPSEARQRERTRQPRPRRPSQLFVVANKLGRQRQWPVGRNYAPPAWLYLPRPRRRFWLLHLPLVTFRSVSARLRWESPLFGTASLFSAMSVLNLGVQGLDLGRWFRLTQRRDFDLKARGTLRLVAGLQSVASFLLLALTAYILLVQPIGE